MIYVIESRGKGCGYANTIKFLTFLSEDEASKHISSNVLQNSEGHKYWVRYDTVEAGDVIENYAE